MGFPIILLKIHVAVNDSTCMIAACHAQYDWKRIKQQILKGKLICKTIVKVTVALLTNLISWVFFFVLFFF